MLQKACLQSLKACTWFHDIIMLEKKSVYFAIILAASAASLRKYQHVFPFLYPCLGILFLINSHDAHCYLFFLICLYFCIPIWEVKNPTLNCFLPIRVNWGWVDGSVREKACCTITRTWVCISVPMWKARRIRGFFWRKPPVVATWPKWALLQTVTYSLALFIKKDPPSQWLQRTFSNHHVSSHKKSCFLEQHPYYTPGWI